MNSHIVYRVIVIGEVRNYADSLVDLMAGRLLFVASLVCQRVNINHRTAVPRCF